MITSLCGCLSRNICSPQAFFAFNDKVGAHYKANPKCKAKAEQDPVWQFRLSRKELKFRQENGNNDEVTW